MEDDNEFECVACNKPLRVDHKPSEPIGISCGHNLCRECGEVNVNVTGTCSVWFCCNATIATEIGEYQFKLFPKNDVLMDVMTFDGKTLPNREHAPTDCVVCHIPMASKGYREPMQMSACGHSFCHSCVLDAEASDHHDPRCPVCGADISRDRWGDWVVNLVLKKKLQRYERDYEECGIHPGYLKFFVCQKDGCNWARICFKCTKDGAHERHEHNHIMEEVDVLRKRIPSAIAAYEEFKKKFKRNKNIHLEIAKTFETDHPDHINLRGSIEEHYNRLLWVDSPSQHAKRKTYENCLVSMFCVNQIAYNQTGSKRSRLLIDFASEQRSFLLQFLYCSPSAMIKVLDKIRGALNDQPLWMSKYRAHADFEYDRLGRYYMNRIGDESKLSTFWDVEVFFDNSEAEKIWGAFIGWIVTFGARENFQPIISEDRAIFYYNRDRIRCKVTRPEHFDEQSPFNAFRLKNRKRTFVVYSKDSTIWICGRPFLEIVDAFYVMLDIMTHEDVFADLHD